MNVLEFGLAEACLLDLERLLLDLLYKSELVDRDSLLVALLLAELPTEEEIKKTLITYSVN